MKKLEKPIVKPIIENIRFLVKQKHIPMGDFELYGLNVSPGYLSRAYHTDFLPVTLVAKAAYEFDVTIDDLINKDMERDSKITDIAAEIERLQKMLEQEGHKNGRD